MSDAPKFTPGPWHKAGGKGRTLIAAGSVCVAAITHHPDVPGEDEGNANIVTAAPEMYERGDALAFAVTEYLSGEIDRGELEATVDAWVAVKRKADGEADGK